MGIVPKSKEGIHSHRADRAHDAKLAQFYKTLHHVNGSVRGGCSHLGPKGIKGLRHVNVAAEPLYMNHVGEDAEEPLEASKLVKLSWFGQRACFSSTQNSAHQR